LEVLTAAVAVDLSCKLFTDELHPVGTEQNECMMDAGARVQQANESINAITWVEDLFG
jgi:hypothetical protein